MCLRAHAYTTICVHLYIFSHAFSLSSDVLMYPYNISAMLPFSMLLFPPRSGTQNLHAYTHMHTWLQVGNSAHNAASHAPNLESMGLASIWREPAPLPLAGEAHQVRPESSRRSEPAVHHNHNSIVYSHSHMNGVDSNRPATDRSNIHRPDRETTPQHGESHARTQNAHANGASAFARHSASNSPPDSHGLGSATVIRQAQLIPLPRTDPNSERHDTAAHSHNHQALASVRPARSDVDLIAAEAGGLTARPSISFASSNHAVAPNNHAVASSPHVTVVPLSHAVAAPSRSRTQSAGVASLRSVPNGLNSKGSSGGVIAKSNQV